MSLSKLFLLSSLYVRCRISICGRLVASRSAFLHLPCQSLRILMQKECFAHPNPEKSHSFWTPVSPLRPKTCRVTLASVPAPLTSLVLTSMWYLQGRGSVMVTSDNKSAALHFNCKIKQCLVEERGLPAGVLIPNATRNKLLPATFQASPCLLEPLVTREAVRALSRRVEDVDLRRVGQM